jgi:hypothetical protein
MQLMSKRDVDGTWVWLQSSKGEKIGLHLHPYKGHQKRAIDLLPRLAAPRVTRMRRVVPLVTRPVRLPRKCKLL